MEQAEVKSTAAESGAKRSVEEREAKSDASEEKRRRLEE
jgi:hypothetical protein